MTTHGFRVRATTTGIRAKTSPGSTRAASRASASMCSITTEKDWVRLRRLRLLTPTALRPERAARRSQTGEDRVAGKRSDASVPVKRVRSYSPPRLARRHRRRPCPRSPRGCATRSPGRSVLLAGPRVQLLVGAGARSTCWCRTRGRGARRLRAAYGALEPSAPTRVVLSPASFEAAASAIYWGGSAPHRIRRRRRSPVAPHRRAASPVERDSPIRWTKPATAGCPASVAAGARSRA